MKITTILIVLISLVRSSIASVIEEKLVKSYDTQDMGIINEILFKEGATEFQIDSRISNWNEQWTFLKEKDHVIEKTEILTVEELLERQPSMKEYFTKKWTKPNVMNGNRYVFNLPIVAVLEITISNHGTFYYPLGIDSLGDYRVPLLKRD